MVVTEIERNARSHAGHPQYVTPFMMRVEP
jgi:hypothetical protein